MTSAEFSRGLFFGSVATAALPFLLLIAAGCSSPPAHEHHFSGSTMGTSYFVKVIAPLGEEERAQIAQDIQASLDRVDQKMSTYREDSELSRFNQHTSTEPFALSPETFEVFRIAQEVSAQTDGAFDVTVGPIVNAYGFGPEKSARPPGGEEIARLRERVGYQHLALDAAARTVSKARPDLYCDLSAVAKGYAVDKVAETLNARGLENYMVEVGGETRTRGRNAAGRPWQIAIEWPMKERGRVERVVPMSNISMATSGDYRNYFEVDGKRVSHTIDPRTGKPIEHALASVSVLHESCAWADAYATAINVLGLDAGFNFAVAHNLPVVLIAHNGDENFSARHSPAFDPYIPKAAGPVQPQPRALPESTQRIPMH